MAVRRTGSKRSPRAAPAKLPKVVGVKGGRKVVKPISGIEVPRACAMMPSMGMLLILPWSVAMPVVV